MVKTRELYVKGRLYILGALILIVLGIAVNTYVQNHKENISKLQAENAIITAENKEEAKKVEEQKEKDQAAEEKQKQLDDKYKEAQDALDKKDFNKAITTADEILAIDNKNYKAYNIKGIAICYGKKFQFEEGMSFIDKALTIKNDYGYGRFCKALAYQLYGKYEDALEWYDKDLQVENYTWSYYNEACIYATEGNVAKTVDCLKTAIAMEPSIKDAAKNEVDFANMKKWNEFNQLLK